MSDAIYNIRQEQYTTVIREMIRHENDVTNHRIMWLLIGEGFIANAFVVAWRGSASAVFMLSFAGILVTLSAFLMLYKSYQARGYLEFLGKQAKQGTLHEEHLPLVVAEKKDQRLVEGRLVCPWFRQAGDLLEPWLFLPSLFMFMWLIALLQRRTSLDLAVNLMLAVILAAMNYLGSTRGKRPLDVGRPGRERLFLQTRYLDEQ
ncbi:MAG: hypothetical protein ABR903_07315 [Thermodesulfovibrionales bacterium]